MLLSGKCRWEVPKAVLILGILSLSYLLYCYFSAPYGLLGPSSQVLVVITVHTTLPMFACIVFIIFFFLHIYFVRMCFIILFCYLLAILIVLHNILGLFRIIYFYFSGIKRVALAVGGAVSV